MVMNCTETKVCFDMYVEGLEIENKLELIFKENTVARSCMTYKKDEDGQLVGRFFSAFPITYRVNNIEGVFNHEIGTHYIRKHNNNKQIWHQKRSKYHLKNYMATEEGLASIN